MVCKGDATKFTYICPVCDALYCANCAKTLVGLENACWACNAPIDESKPVKLGEEEEEMPLAQEDLNKKKLK